ncbi:hypothetical protein BAY61_13595 [Prauserella marina]|uniref:Uncharacterized protein n=1 Tax=Prauserella marina TaxID=530584 RepID=A0A222VPL7_9PSEU|nr:hypothetical protein [Prauserella marina]ASR35866.1 hypothetical protein BAY61_13595 [Prauserella marina]PWV84216.1 hypothetical protein DES30_101233 [Prauserella marina]SDC27823.1 hypothetical protein SAMN05421630_1011104 [Prauserella marina]
MSRRTTARTWTARLLVMPATLAAMGIFAPHAVAEEAADPVLAGADIAVTMNEDGNDVVRSTFTLASPLTEATPVNLLFTPHNGTELGELTGISGIGDIGTLDGVRAEATLPEGTTEYTVEQRNERDPAAYGVPLAIPEIPTDRAARISISVSLPEGQRLVGDTMPTFHQQSEEGDRIVLRHTSRSLPSVTVAEYGTTSTASLGTISSWVGAVTLVVVVVFWLIHTLRQERARS